MLCGPFYAHPRLRDALTSFMMTKAPRNLRITIAHRATRCWKRRSAWSPSLGRGASQRTNECVSALSSLSRPNMTCHRLGWQRGLSLVWGSVGDAATALHAWCRCYPLGHRQHQTARL